MKNGKNFVYKKMWFTWCLGIVVLIFLSGIIIIYLVSANQKTSYCYPNIDETVIEEIMAGHHTDYFDSTSILNGFLDERYAEYDREITIVSESNSDKTYQISLFSLTEEISLKVKLHKTKLDDTSITIWMVEDCKILESRTK